MTSRNENSFVSSIPQPSKNGSPAKSHTKGHLGELSASATNCRSQAMGPPSKVQRKTLVERAGEITKQPAPNFRPGSAYANATSLNGVPRNTSFSSSVSSRPPSSASSRTFSNTSYSSSVGPGTRPASVNAYRSNSSSNHSRLQRAAHGRSATPLDPHHEETPGGQVLGKRKAWDIDQKWEEMEIFRDQVTENAKVGMEERKELKECLNVYKSLVGDLERQRDELSSSNRQIQKDLDDAKSRTVSVTEALEDQKRHQTNRLDDSDRQHRRVVDDLQHEHEAETRRLWREHTDALEDLQRNLDNRLADERGQHKQEVEALSNEGAYHQQEIEKELDAQLSALKTIEDDIDKYKSDISREQDLNQTLRDQLAAASKREAGLERSVQRLEGHIQFLESDNKSQSQAFADLEARMQKAIRESEEAKEKLIKEETLRRKLHNQVQELKGNIRVFCRVRPSLDSDSTDATAHVSYPDQEIDAKELEVMGPEEKSSLGNITTKKHAFSFDRVFGPSSLNADVFGEISQLVQSALDGYNVCIFCYGQTGSGKTFTMSSADGMIPLAVHQIYSTAKSLEEKGWKYSMAGSFIEVYNENLNDLLGKAEEFDKKKHEIRHDTQRCKTEVTGIKTVELDSPGRVEEILRNAARNRTVAATQANERSSRSHSVFILKLNGENKFTGERSEGTLNLVDLAGSERLSHSGATGDRLKETQNINKSLSCLGDVIGALGQGKDGGHIPYRNSKLTYLLQFSLGGNSKTLMFVMVSPLQAHLSESLTSLKFATKVHNTHIGTAKKQVKVKD